MIVKIILLLTSAVVTHSAVNFDSVHADPVNQTDFCSIYDGQKLDLSNLTVIREEGIQRSYEGYNNLEGPVWLDGALFYSNIGNKNDPETGQFLNNQTTIWRWVPGNKAEIWLDDSIAGSNGMAIDENGDLVMARHLDGSITRLDSESKSLTTLADGFQGKRFNSPNDLTIASDGTIYFTDPDWNVPITNSQPIQGGDAQHVYRINAKGDLAKTNATELVEKLGNKPNGIVLSLDETELLVAGLEGLWSFKRGADDLSSPKRLMNTPIDGMGKDCAGNIYVTTTRANSDSTNYQTIVILDKAYSEVGEIPIPDIQIVTNVAFGGPDRDVLYITSLTVPDKDDGSGPRICSGNPCKAAGIYSVQLNVPGFPY